MGTRHNHTDPWRHRAITQRPRTQNITVRTVNSPINKLRPRATYHLDLLVLGLLTGAASVCGLPWMCAATVESINHIKACKSHARVTST